MIGQRTAAAGLAPHAVGVLTRLLAWWANVKGWRHRKRAVAELRALDNRMLKDIGIERSEIESVVRGLRRDRSRVDRT
jgi:uncharacterized protein YjiS (DUF1127 family)